VRKIRILECSIQGDTRFSPQYAKVHIFHDYDTIENLYLKCQKTKDNKQSVIGDIPHHLVIYFMYFDKKHLNSYLKLMWIKYLDENPHLVQVLKDYDEYSDMFDGVFIQDSQADILRKYIKNGKDSLLEECKDFLKLIKNKHWNQ